MKKFLALILAVLMIAGSAVSVSAAFTDVPETHKHAEAIDALQAQKVVAGTTETTFDPDANVTRWQMALFMARATSGKTDDANWENGAALFADCTQYLGAIQYCFVKGIIKGVTATEFAPNANITLRDGVVMAVRALGYEKADEGVEASAKKYNVTGATYWLPYYQTGSELGLLENLETVAVTKELTRAETAQLIYNMLYTEVYVSADVDKSYTLNDVAFGGMEVVEVENVTPAYISETPLYHFGNDTIAIDEEDGYVIATVIDDEGNATDVEIPYAKLAKAGVDVDNIDAYFGAYLELVNCDVKNAGRDNETIEYDTFETIINVDNKNSVVLSKSEISIDEDYATNGKVKINGKTHYIAGTQTTARNAQFINLYEADYANCDAEDVDDVALTASTFSGSLYDVKLFDLDLDGYYEEGIVSRHYLAQYAEANVRGVETIGMMKGFEVEYSEELDDEDVFVYTFDPFTLTVDVKEVIEAQTGVVKGYNSQKVNNTTKNYVKIDDASYLIAAGNPGSVFAEGSTSGDLIDTDICANNTEMTSAAIKEWAQNSIGETYTYYVFDGKILAFGEVAEEEEAVTYAVIKDFTDFELYDYVTLAGFVDGKETEIKVNKITKYVTDPDTGATVPEVTRISKLGYKALTEVLNDIEGVYSYTVDADGYYSIKAKDFEYTLGGLGIPVTGGSLVFQDYNEVYASGVARANILRINSSTQIFTINGTTVTKITPQIGKQWSIDNVTEDTKVYVDKLGFGDPNAEYDDRPAHGVASIIYLETTGEVVSNDGYTLVFVDEALKTYELGTADEYGLDVATDDDDTDADTPFLKYTVDGNAYTLDTFKAVGDLYLEKNGAVGALEAGIYLVDADNVIVDGKGLDEVGTAGLKTLSSAKGAKLAYTVAEIAASDIRLYDYNNVTLGGFANNSADVKKVTFIDYDYIPARGDEDAYFEKYTKSNDSLVSYLTKEYGADTKVTVIIAANKKTSVNESSAYADNTIRGIILEDIIPQDSAIEA